MGPGDQDFEAQDEELVATPFSFKLVLVLGVLYLGWRLIQFLLFLVDRFF